VKIHKVLVYQGEEYELKPLVDTKDRWGRARKPPAVVSAIRSAIARAAWGKLSADERKARQQRVWAQRKAKYADKEPAK
jgi:hypothetical protein